MIDLLLVFIVGFLTSILGAMVGSGGVIMIPFLILLGLSPTTAIATSKLAAVGMISGATSRFWREKKIVWKFALPFLGIGIVGSILGANLLLNVNDSFLEKGVGVVIILILPLLFLNKKLGIHRQEISPLKKYVGFFMYFLIAVYSGFFGPGTGTFILYASMFFFGLTMLESNASSLLAGLASNVASFAVFVFAGVIDWASGIVLLVSGVLGGYVGAHAAIKKGDKWIKMAFAVVALVMAVKLLL